MFGAIVINTILFLVWLLLMPDSAPWFVYPASCSVAMLSVYYVVFYVEESKWLKLHLMLSVNFNLLLIFTYVALTLKCALT